MSGGRYAGLDGLRGLAAFAVVIHHSLILGTDIGGLSVFLFFILSGFLITGILHRSREKIEAGKLRLLPALEDFWIRRALRIFPAYYLWLGVFVVIDVTVRKGEILPDLPWYLVYLQNFLLGFVTFKWGDFTHVWSLAVEQQYYVFFAPLVVLVPTRWHAKLMIATILLCLATIAGLQAIGYEMITLYTSPANGFVFMAAGALMTLERARTPAWMGATTTLLVAVAAVVALACYPIAERTVGFHLPYVVLQLASVTALSAVMIHVLQHPEGVVTRALETRPLKFLGLISYGLYVIHLPVGVFAEQWLPLEVWSQATGLPKPVVDFAVMASVSIGLATLSWHLFEARILALKDRFQRG
ncbi:MAG: acyltransferase [Hyphomicrobiales bacterium]|nr:acyltransferase [Hyphomicrobiales bacterium]